MTFSQLFLGLVLLKIPGAVGKSLLIALVDILPVFGCGTVLIPWACVRFALGNIPGAMGILILYGVIFLIRQIAEPKIIGDSLGLHPVLSLILFMLGLSLFGFFGLLLMPLAGVCLAELFRTRTDEKEKTPLE